MDFFWLKLKGSTSFQNHITEDFENLYYLLNLNKSEDHMNGDKILKNHISEDVIHWNTSFANDKIDLNSNAAKLFRFQAQLKRHCVGYYD